MKIILNNNSLFKSLRPFSDIGFVPTMGGIHRGHLSLIDRSNRACKKASHYLVNSNQAFEKASHCLVNSNHAFEKASHEGCKW